MMATESQEEIFAGDVELAAVPFHVAKLQVDFWQLMRSQHFPVRDADVSYAIGLLMKSGWWFQIAS